MRLDLGGILLDNVKPIHPGIRPPSGEPSSALIKVLRDLFAMAEDGRLQSFVGTGWLADGNRVSIVADFHQNVYEMLGALESLKVDYIKRHDL